MERVWIVGAAVAHPPHTISQEEAARQIGEATGEPRRVAALAKGTRIDRRAIALPAFEIGKLGTIEERNTVYQKVAPALAIDAARQIVAGDGPDKVSFLITSSC